jgi:hypothetical protein
MIKRTKVFYPHIVKQYDSVEQFVSENGYADFAAALKAEITSAGIDVTDSSRYVEALSDDGFEAKATIVFTDQAEYDAYLAGVATEHSGIKTPIFEENVEEHLI